MISAWHAGTIMPWYSFPSLAMATRMLDSIAVQLTMSAQAITLCCGRSKGSVPMFV